MAIEIGGVFEREERESGRTGERERGKTGEGEREWRRWGEWEKSSFFPRTSASIRYIRYIPYTARCRTDLRYIRYIRYTHPLPNFFLLNGF